MFSMGVVAYLFYCIGVRPRTKLKWPKFSAIEPNAAAMMGRW